MRADRPGPTRPKPDKAEISIPTQKGVDSVEIDRPNANANECQLSREAFGQDRFRQELSRPNQRSRRTIDNTRLKQVSARSGRESNRRRCAVDEGRAVDRQHCSEIYYNRSRKKVRARDMVGRMEPMVQGHASDMVDWVATLVWLDRLGMLELEDEVRRGG